MTEAVKIAGASGFWGDSPYAYEQFLGHQKIVDYITADYLSEVTLGLLSFRKSRDPELGYIEEFPMLFSSLAPHLKRLGVKLVCNAGGLNPRSLMKKLESLETGLKIACVVGDDLKKESDTCLSKNVYLGCSGIVEALNLGAQVVITGRVVDSALTLGPLVYEYNWKWDEFDKLSAGSLAGHLLECGAQSTGGNFTDWEKIDDFSNVGYPIAEVKECGEFILTKPEKTGGCVNYFSVCEQLVYEISDPYAYLLPDVTCDWGSVDVFEEGKNRVLIRGAKGLSPRKTYKALETQVKSYKLDAYMTLIGPQNTEKAERCFSSLKKRFSTVLSKNKLPNIERSLMTIFGADSQKMKARESFEVLLKMSFVHQNPKALKLLTGEFAFLSTSMTPGFTQLIGGRPKPTPIIKTSAFEINKEEVEEFVVYNGSETKVDKVIYPEKNIQQSAKTPLKVSFENEKLVNCKLKKLCVARSGDKGNHCNIGVIARSEKIYQYLVAVLDEAFIESHFFHFFDNPDHIRVERYFFEKLHAFNFVLFDSLGGGGMNSLRIDPQGKAYAQQLLDIEIEIPQSLI